MAPSLDDVRMTVDAPVGAVVSYPGDGSSSGLYGGDQLHQGETDASAFRLDVSGLKPGQYEFKVLPTYTRDGSPFDISGVVGVTISEYPITIECRGRSEELDPVESSFSRRVDRRASQRVGPLAP